MSNRQEESRGRQARVAAERVQARRRARRKELTWIAGTIGALAALVVVVAVVVANRHDSGSGSAPAAAVAPAAPQHGTPRQIAANQAHANRVVDGSIEAKLKQLKGVPVVVNKRHFRAVITVGGAVLIAMGCSYGPASCSSSTSRLGPSSTASASTSSTPSEPRAARRRAPGRWAILRP